MELIRTEQTRLIYLTDLYRPSGPLFRPESAQALAARYSFASVPSLQDLISVGSGQSFKVGKFQNMEIAELGIFPDGFIITANSNTKLLDQFFDDFGKWVTTELGFMETAIAKPERHYESNLLVKSHVDLASAINPQPEVLEAFNSIWKGKFDSKFALSYFVIDTSVHQFSSRRKPTHFSIQRRNDYPVADNVFSSASPLPTDDHIALLERIEKMVSAA